MSLAALLASIAAFVPVPAGLHVIHGRCPYFTAPSNCAIDHTIYVWQNPRLDGNVWTAIALAHEVGHVWDGENLDPTARERYADLVGLPGTWGFPSAMAYETPGSYKHVPAGERFADAYALCALGPRRRRWARRQQGGDYGVYGVRIPRQIIADTCWLLHHPPAPTARK